MDQFSKELGAKVNKYRKAIDMSTTVLANLSDTSQSTISKLENGQSTPNIETLLKICKVLGITLYEILPDGALPDPNEHNPASRQLLGILDQMTESEMRAIQLLLTTNILPVLREISPLIKSLDGLTDDERKLMTNLLYSIINNK